MRLPSGSPLLTVVAGVWASGCIQLTFQCSEDAQCVRDSEPGICEPNRLCSFPDPTCEDGFRYAADGPPSKRSQCVDPHPFGAGRQGELRGGPGTQTVLQVPRSTAV